MSIDALLLQVLNFMYEFTYMAIPYGGFLFGFGLAAWVLTGWKLRKGNFWSDLAIAGVIMGPVAWFAVPGLFEYFFEPIYLFPFWYLPANVVGAMVGYWLVFFLRFLFISGKSLYVVMQKRSQNPRFGF